MPNLLTTICLALALVACTPSPCGNGRLDPGETCDGTAYAGSVPPCAHMVCDDPAHATHCWAVWPTCSERCEVQAWTCP